VIGEVELAILEMEFNLTQLQESLDVTSVGKLTSMLTNHFAGGYPATINGTINDDRANS
jgi:hypothetical protein